MKPSNTANDSPTKASLSKSMKKSSSKSRARGSKTAPPAVPPAPVTCPRGEPSTPTGSGTSNVDPPKEKTHHRSCAGFGPKSIKIFWEQYDTSETEINPEVYPRLAEDATYKVWELVNNIKTFARHSGGAVTAKLVNEVLKNSDVDPILGCVDADWERIDYDGSFYFISDEVLELRDEYLQEITESRPASNFQSSWQIDKKHSKTLLEFFSNLCNSVFLGDNESFLFARETALLSPQIGCILKLLLKKCIEMLAFGQKRLVTQRCLKFIQSISMNSHSRDVQCPEQLFHLAEIFVCILLDTYESIKRPPVKKAVKDDSLASSSNSFETQGSRRGVENTEGRDVDDAHGEYDSLIQIMQEDGCESHQDPMKRNSSLIPTQVELSPYRAEICSLDDVDLICQTIGIFGSCFGYIQSECTFLIIRRLQKFFRNQTILLDKDFEYVSRVIRGLISLGEYSFRELIPFLEKINSNTAPEWIETHLNLAAIFLHGRDDIFLYEWLEDFCGNKLQPFLLHFYKYSQKLITKWYKKRNPATFNIVSKIVLKPIKKLNATKKFNLIEYFPERQLIRKPLKKIEFHFKGCCPITTKNKFARKEFPVVQNSLGNFSSRIIIGRRKLFKPLSDRKTYVVLSNFCFLQL